MLDEPVFFGIYIHLHAQQGVDADIVRFREKRDVALSVSFVIAAVLSAIVSNLIKGNDADAERKLI